MIITKLIGGLGNQMFQYALGKNIALKNNSNLKLDISKFNEYKLRTYDLSCFNIQEDFATPGDLSKVVFPSDKLNQKTKKYMNQYIKRNKIIKYYLEKNFNFQHEILNIPDNAYLDGYWQSEKYFKEIEQIIRAEFTFKSPPDPLNNKIMHQIADCDSVSIHIRRGDYVSNRETNSVHGICSINYYHDAIKEMLLNIDKPYFFVFSDDPEWAKTHLLMDLPLIFLSHNNASKNFEDLRLMSSCKHHIIANSSFSWWGAWLSTDINKIVIVPKKWFKTDKLSARDLILDSWWKI